MGPGHPVDDRKAQAHPSAGSGGVAAPAGFEEVRKIACRNAPARVCDRNHGPALSTCCHEQNATSCWRVLYGVSDDVRHGAGEFADIDLDDLTAEGSRFDPHSLGRRERRDRGHRVRDDVIERGSGDFSPALAVEPRELDDVIDHRVESVDFADDARGRVVGGVILCGGLGQCSDAGQRRSKVVGEPPDRFSPGVLDLAGPLSVGSLGGCLTLHGAGSARQDQADEECKRCARCQHNEQCLGGVIVDKHLPGRYGHAGGKRGDDDERCCDGSHDGLGAGKRRHDCGADQPDARCGEDRQNDGVLVRGHGVPPNRQCPSDTPCRILSPAAWAGMGRSRPSHGGVERAPSRWRDLRRSIPRLRG